MYEGIQPKTIEEIANIFDVNLFFLDQDTKIIRIGNNYYANINCNKSEVEQYIEFLQQLHLCFFTNIEPENNQRILKAMYPMLQNF